MSFDRARLLQLLPTVYGLRDAALGGSINGPLGDLLGVLAEQILVLEEDLDQLYDDQFIETCADWAVPYIGDAIGYRTLHDVSADVGRARAEVAHTIGFRRRKGTVSVLEGLARDVTGWRSAAVEYFQRLITTQYMNHVRRHIHAAPDLRDWRALEKVDTAFDRIPRSIDVRRIESRRGRHNIPNVGMFAWRLQAYPLRFSPAARVDTRRHRFHPLNIDAALFTLPVDVDPETNLVGPLNVPDRISRRVLDIDLDDAPVGEYYADTGRLQSLRLFVDRDDGFGLQPVPRAELCSCHLGDEGATWAHLPAAGLIAIDPVLGRIALPPEATDAWRVRVTYHYGFPADLGGGEYERAASFTDESDSSLATPPTREVPNESATIQAAINFLGHEGLVVITDSGRYEETLTVNVPAGARLEIRAANDHRPTVILGDTLELRGGADSEVRINGLLIAGDALEVPDDAGNALARLDLRHTTLVPGLTLAPDLTPQSPDAESLVVRLAQFTLTLTRCIVGPVRAAEGATLHAVDCVIDAMDVTALAFCAPDPAADPEPGADLTLEGCTVIGRITAHRMPLVSNCILWARSIADEPPVHSELRQDGCVRFTWLPSTSRTPRRHQCLPESAPDVVSTLPRFTALRYGAPGYLQLNVASGTRLMTGADDETEPGVHHHLANTWRETNLRVRLDEYLRVGLSAGIFYET